MKNYKPTFKTASIFLLLLVIFLILNHNISAKLLDIATLLFDLTKNFTYATSIAICVILLCFIYPLQVPISNSTITINLLFILLLILVLYRIFSKMLLNKLPNSNRDAIKNRKNNYNISMVIYVTAILLFLFISIVITPLNLFGVYRNTFFNSITFILGLFIIPLTLGIVIFTLIQANDYIVSSKKNKKHSLLYSVLLLFVLIAYFSFAIIACLNEILLIAKILRHFVIQIKTYQDLKLSETFTPATAIFAFYTTFITYTAKKFFEPYLDRNIKNQLSSGYTYSIEELQQLEMLNSMKIQPKHSINSKPVLTIEEIDKQINAIKDKASIKKTD